MGGDKRKLSTFNGSQILPAWSATRISVRENLAYA